MQTTMIALLVFNLLSVPISKTVASKELAAFKVSSLNTSFSFVGVYEGEYSVRPEAVEVMVKKATIFLRNNAPYKGRRMLKSITVGLAVEQEKGQWKFVSKSPGFIVEKVMSPGEEYKVEGLNFVIPREGSTDLSKYWLVFQIEATPLDLGEGSKPVTGHSYAHSGHDIFVKR